MSTSETGAHGSGGIVGTIKGALAIFVKIAQTRLELAATEAQLEYERLWPILILVLASAMFIGMAFLCLNVFIIILFWENHREQILLFLIGLYTFAALIVAMCVRRAWLDRGKLCSSVIEELGKDLKSLQG